jgi:hypothetical protein
VIHLHVGEPRFHGVSAFGEKHRSEGDKGTKST